MHFPLLNDGLNKHSGESSKPWKIFLCPSPDVYLLLEITLLPLCGSAQLIKTAVLIQAVDFMQMLNK